MKKLFIIPFFLMSCAEIEFTTSQYSCHSNTNNTYSNGSQLQEIITRYAAQGIPGISVAIRKGSGYWEGSSGYASIEQKVLLQPCHLMYAQSLAKTYTAVVTLMLAEEGKVILDNSIRDYLPENIWKEIEHSDKITVRMLLNHTSGIFDYAYDYGYATYLLNNGDRVFSKELILKYILDGKAKFYPGTKYSYCNSGYFLLAYMAEYITGQSHATLIRQMITLPLGLSDTYYREEVKQVVESGLVNCYLDRFSNGQLENVSKQQINNILAMLGDDSIVATPADYLTFLDGLIVGKLISPQSFAQMTQWVNNSKNEPAYGLGLTHHVEQGIPGFGHSGSGLGAGCSLYYYPEKDVTIFIGVNVNTLIPSTATDQLDNMKEEIHQAVFKE